MRKRSAYKPKGVRLDNLSWVVAGLKKVGTLPVSGVSIKLKNHEALDEVLKGKATRDHVDVLIAALNMAEALTFVRDELGADWHNEIQEAQTAVLTMARRGVEKGSFAFTAKEMQFVKFAMNLHDLQLDECTVKEMEKALDLVAEVIRNKRARIILEKT